jgi:hypothetical protein
MENADEELYTATVEIEHEFDNNSFQPQLYKAKTLRCV